MAAADATSVLARGKPCMLPADLVGFRNKGDHKSTPQYCTFVLLLNVHVHVMYLRERE